VVGPDWLIVGAVGAHRSGIQLTY